MDIGHIPLFAAFSKRMAWLTQRQTVLAENVANANTPGNNSASFTGVRPWAVDPDAAKQLWAMSEEMLGERFAL